MMKRLVSRSVVLVVLLFLVVGCASDKKPAEQAINLAEDALSAVKAEAMKYVPDQVKAVEGAITAAKDSFGKKDYKAALNAAKDLPAKVKELAAAAASKKEELTKAWGEMSAGLPKMLDAIKSRVDILSKSRKLPANLDKAKFDGVKAGYEEATKVWTDATSAFGAGNLADAMAKAKAVKDKAVEVMTTLGMQIPEAAKS